MDNEQTMIHMVLIDDNQINLLIIEHHAHMLGLCTKRFTDPIKALEYLKEVPCDIIVTDYMMPEMDGLEFVRAFRSTASVHVPIVLSTAMDNDSELMKKAREAGVDAFLPKPIDPTLFKTIIFSLLKDAK